MMNLSPPGARGSGFIVPSCEHEPLDQTDIDWTVILDPLGRWSVILEESPYWTLGQGGRPAPGPVRLPIRSCGFWSLL